MVETVASRNLTLVTGGKDDCVRVVRVFEVVMPVLGCLVAYKDDIHTAVVNV